MLCECGEREATIHETIIKNGKKIEKHLCEVCAQKQGLGPKGTPPISQLISSFVLASQAARSTPLVCTVCETSFESFKQSGLLGCPACYDAFEPLLGPMIERSHEGGTHHTGKRPRRALGGGPRVGAGEDPVVAMRMRSDRIARLRKDLDRALKDEQYERAAKLRDEIDRLVGGGGSESAR